MLGNRDFEEQCTISHRSGATDVMLRCGFSGAVCCRISGSTLAMCSGLVQGTTPGKRMQAAGPKG
jgi:hypothetical protein